MSLNVRVTCSLSESPVIQVMCSLSHLIFKSPVHYQSQFFSCSMQFTSKESPVTQATCSLSHLMSKFLALTVSPNVRVISSLAETPYIQVFCRTSHLKSKPSDILVTCSLPELLISESIGPYHNWYHTVISHYFYCFL